MDRTAPAATEGSVVVLLDVARDDQLRLEGDARDLNRVIQDLRKRAGLRYSDRIVVSLAGKGIESLLASFGPWLKERALAVKFGTGEIDKVVATGTARLAFASVEVSIGRQAVEPQDLAEHRAAPG